MRPRLLAWLAPVLVFSCGPDAQPLECHGGPDFEVLITAQDLPLPADTVIRLHYGGRAFDDPEELTLADPETPQALFCYLAARDGTYDATAPALGSDPLSASGGAAGAPSTGGPGGPIEALLCRLWTDGSADLDVVTQMYGTTSVKLQTRKRVCTVESVVELAPPDAGSGD
jgi:hypothetical protein